VGYRSLHVETSADTLVRIVGHEPGLVLVDVSQPNVDAVGLTAQLREWTSAPIVALAARGRERERAQVLDAGANDYIEWPSAIADLLVRVRVWLRQEARVRRQDAPPPQRPTRLKIHGELRTVVVEGREVHLTPLERDILVALAKSRSKTLTEKQLLAAIWGRGDAPQASYLRAQVRHLRRKIEANPARPRHLLTVPGGGYRLKLG
jgi:two-component system KDP operon response regulator KdpE